MGLVRTIRCGVSYMRSALLPQREEKTLEDFIINRFGKQLYLTFFKSYTEKVWGVPCNQISAEWGAQRIKGLSLKGVVLHFLKKTFGANRRRYCAEKDRNLADREISLSQVRPRPALGTRSRSGSRRAAAKSTLAFRSIASTLNGNTVVSVEGVNEAGERVDLRRRLLLLHHASPRSGSRHSASRPARFLPK